MRRMSERTRILASLAHVIGDDAVPSPAVAWTDVEKALQRVPLRVLHTLLYRIKSVEVAAAELKGAQNG